MGVEIERKYRVTSNGWRANTSGAVRMRQGYFRTAPESTVRVRLVDPVGGDGSRRGELTIKGRPRDAVRPEFEYTISPDDVERMLDLFCDDRIVTKVRYRVDHRDALWVVDEFEGRNEGLVLAEIELESPDQPFDEPEWLGSEVSDDPAWTNAELARHPIDERDAI